MTAEQLQQIKDLFDAAFDLAPEERERFLAKACDGDFRLFTEVQKLFATNDEEPEFLEASPALIQLSELSPASNPEVATGRRIGAYQIIREIGRGGMGAVFLAHRADEAFHKQVAVKLVWPGSGSDEIVQRFRQERQILARLEHPNITRLLDGGTTADGWHYVVLEYVAGTPVTTYCEQQKLSQPARLELFRTICHAVQYAHQNLVIHRDIKPGNILVTADGTPKLLDFGIAKLLEPDEASLALTRTQFPLTPEYASPEQLRNEPVTTATDIYSLGVVLYELLTGNKPHDLKKLSLSQLARVVSEAEPTPPKLNHELDNILLRALRKEPAARYQSVEQFAEDVRRYLAGEPVLARPTSFAYRTGIFLRKNKLAVALAASLLLTLLAILATSIRQNFIAKAQARVQRHHLYAAEIQQAAQAKNNEDILSTRKILAHWLPQAGTEDLRGFEWYYLWRFVHPEELLVTMPDVVSQAWLLPGTERLYVRDVSGNRKVFHAVTGQELWAYQDQPEQGTTRDWPFKGEVFALEDGNRIVIWDVVRGLRKSEFIDADAPLQDVSQIDETRFMTADSRGTVKIRERATGNLLHVFTGIETPITAFAGIGAPNALALVSSERNVTVQPFDQSTQPFHFSETSNIKSIRVDDARHRLLIHIGDGLVIRDSRNGHLLSKLHPAQGDLMSFFFAKGSDVIFLISSAHQVSVLEAQSLREIGVLGGHQGNVFTQMFLPEKNWFVTSSEDRTVRIWDILAQKEMAKFRGHTGDVIAAALSADRKKLITGSQDHTARIWDIAQARQPDVLQGHTDHILTAAFSPDNQHIATAGKDSTAIISDIQTGAQLILRGHHSMIFSVAFSPDGKILATGSNDGTAKLWDAATGKEIKTISNGSREYMDGVRNLTFTHDGQRLIAGCNDGTIKVWDVGSGHLLTNFRAHEREVLSVSLSPDGQRLASGSWDQTAKLWDTATWQELAILKGHQGKVWSTEFSPDGKQLATGSGDFTVKLWDVASAQVLRTLDGHSDGVFSVSFTPDGKRLATCSDDKTVRIWNPATGEELLTLRDHTDEVWCVAFSADGKVLASASWDKTIRLRRMTANITLPQ